MRSPSASAGARKLSVDGSAVGERASSARSAASQRAPTCGSEKNAAAMIGLMIDPGIASENTAGFNSASGR